MQKTAFFYWNVCPFLSQLSSYTLCSQNHETVPWISGICLWNWSCSQHKITNASLFSNWLRNSYSCSLLENKFNVLFWLIETRPEIKIMKYRRRINFWKLGKRRYLLSKSRNVEISWLIRLPTIVRQCFKLLNSIWNKLESSSKSIASFFHAFLVYWKPEMLANSCEHAKKFAAFFGL